jgi:hypothetical protein
MKQSQFERYALSIIVAATTVAGCGGGSQPSVGPPGAIPQSSARATHAAPGKSWMLRKAKRDLL